MGTKPRGDRKSPTEKTPTFLLELPLAVEVCGRCEPIPPRPGGTRYPSDPHAGAQSCLHGLRFLLQKPTERNQGYLIWRDEQLPAIIAWNDPVIKYARLVQRKAI